MIRPRFRLKTLLLLTAGAAILLSVFLTVVVPKSREHRAFAQLSNRILYVGIIYDGPTWISRSYSNHWYFQRVWHIRMRIEAKDSDRTELLDQLARLPNLEKIELVAGDPLLITQDIIQQTAAEIESALPGVEVSVLSK